MNTQDRGIYNRIADQEVYLIFASPRLCAFALSFYSLTQRRGDAKVWCWQPRLLHTWGLLPSTTETVRISKFRGFFASAKHIPSG